MSALFIVAIAPLGVAALIGLVYLFGGTTRASFATADEAFERFARDYPQWQGDEAILSDDGHIALIPSATTDEIGLVFAIGDTFVTRLLQPGDFEQAAEADGPAKIHFHDFSAPDIEVPHDLIARLDQRVAA